ncbi:MAG: hypothetical protein U1E29_17630 [Coriobacteriia bacterium]|nr:hypothetical protein [Coriobacteriia bacterium]
MNTETSSAFGAFMHSAALVVLAVAIVLAAAMMANAMNYSAYANAHGAMVSAKTLAKPGADISTQPMPPPRHPWDF